MGEGIREDVVGTLGFHNELPYSALRIYLGEQVPSRLEEARTHAGACCDEYEQYVAQGRNNRLHRVGHRLFDPNQECRQQLNIFCQSALPPPPSLWLG